MALSKALQNEDMRKPDMEETVETIPRTKQKHGNTSVSVRPMETTTKQYEDGNLWKGWKKNERKSETRAEAEKHIENPIQTKNTHGER